MKEFIPFDKFVEFLTKEPFEEGYESKAEEHFKLMTKVEWKDFENLSKEELEKVPIAWIYDWTNVTANFHLQELVPSLYEKQGLTVLTPEQYLRKYGHKEQEIFSKFDLRYNIRHFLIDNEEFIDLVEKGLLIKLKGKTPEEKMDILKCHIGNTSRTFILKIIVLNFLQKLLLEEQDKYLDIYWKEVLKDVLNDLK